MSVSSKEEKGVCECGCTATIIPGLAQQFCEHDGKPMKIGVIITERCCPKHPESHDKYLDDRRTGEFYQKFCPACGSKIETRQRFEEKPRLQTTAA